MTDHERVSVEPVKKLPRTAELILRTPKTLLISSGHFFDLAKNLGLIETSLPQTHQASVYQEGVYKDAIDQAAKAIPHIKQDIDFQPIKLARELAIKMMPTWTKGRQKLEQDKPNIQSFYEVDNDWLITQATQSRHNLNKILHIIETQLASLTTRADQSTIQEFMNAYQETTDTVRQTRALSMITLRLSEAEAKLPGIQIQMESIRSILEQLNTYIRKNQNPIREAVKFISQPDKIRESAQEFNRLYQLAKSLKKVLADQQDSLKHMQAFLPKVQTFVSEVASASSNSE